MKCFWPGRLAIAALALAAGAASAQPSFPIKPVTLIVPFAAGGPNDVMSRIVAEHMSRTFGQPILIENVAGAGGTTGSARVAVSQPDGYTLLSGHVGTHAAAPALYPKLRYNPLTDFSPIGLVAETPILVATRHSLQVDTLQAFVGLAKQKDADLTLGHAGVGSIGHISCLLLSKTIEIKPTEVPYRGSAPAMIDLIAGRSDYTCALLVDVLPFIGSASLKFLAVSAPARVPQLPSTPTAAEAGMPEFRASSWFAFYLPKATPDSIRDRFVAALDSALSDPAVRKRFVDSGLVLPAPDMLGPAPLKQLMIEETARWSDIIRSARITAE
ncbi:tripartite tricarboxylate transporter substrate-binding protein [Tardiphaga sp.]|uniref:tripartite tricarboxylate transporter substrate-binding protein n=1 Tax=Tardiphaga sp. TaxID=1926292 RepID=UPI0025CFAB62|nr:tripartite tricarboxylate transporter substrate-binding protein [Tardiphaga sp.]